MSHSKDIINTEDSDDNTNQELYRKDDWALPDVWTLWFLWPSKLKILHTQPQVALALAALESDTLVSHRDFSSLEIENIKALTESDTHRVLETPTVKRWWQLDRPGKQKRKSRNKAQSLSRKKNRAQKK